MNEQSSERPLVKVKPQLSWRPQDTRDARRAAGRAGTSCACCRWQEPGNCDCPGMLEPEDDMSELQMPGAELQDF